MNHGPSSKSIARKQKMETLAKTGQMETLTAWVNQQSERLVSAYKEITDDTTITDDHKNDLLNRRLDRAERELDEEIDRLYLASWRHEQVDGASVLGVDGLNGDPASLRIALRDAQERVTGITDEDELEQMMDTAMRTGDETMVRALLGTAFERRLERLINRYMITLPDDHPMVAKLQRLWDQGDRRGGTPLSYTLARAGFTPAWSGFKRQYGGTA